MHFSKKKCFFTIITFSIFFSSLHGMQNNDIPVAITGLNYQESNNFTIARRVGGVVSILTSGFLLYDFFTNEKQKFRKKTFLASMALFCGGIGAFNAQELRLTRWVYHKNNSQQEDEKISELAFAYKNKKVQRIFSCSDNQLKTNKAQQSDDEESDSEDEESEDEKEDKSSEHVTDNTIKIPISFLSLIYETKRGKKANDFYLSQQRPLLTRIPVAGILFDGLFFDKNSIEFFKEVVAAKDSSIRLFGLSLWFSFGCGVGIYKWWKQEKTPEDKEFEKWLSTYPRRCSSIWLLYEKERAKKEVTSYLGVLPPEVYDTVTQFVLNTTSEESNINVKKGSRFISISGEDCARYVVPYIGPWLTVNIDGSVAICKGNGNQDKYHALEQFLSKIGACIWK